MKYKRKRRSNSQIIIQSGMLPDMGLLRKEKSDE
jgi:hypothetical protein